MEKEEIIKRLKSLGMKGLEKAKQAVEEMLDYYRGDWTMVYCPLCFISDHHCTEVCLWGIVEGCSCHNFAKKVGFDKDVRILRDERNLKWVEIRTPMLEKWLNIIEEALSEMEEVKNE